MTAAAAAPAEVAAVAYQHTWSHWSRCNQKLTTTFWLKLNQNIRISKIWSY
jgi:hypothetical protein